MNRPPSYRRHKASGRAVVTLSGKDFYLGPWRSAESKRNYDKIVASWIASGRQLEKASAQLLIADLLAAYWTYLKDKQNGHTGELWSNRLWLRVVRALFADKPIVEFGPLSLKAVQKHLVTLGWARNYINVQINRVRRCFKWGVSNEIVPETIWRALCAVPPLKHGETTAPETAKIKPVDNSWVEQTLPNLSAQVRAMVRLQQLTGMRPGEVCKVRGCDIDMGPEVWKYVPTSHKNTHRGHSRTIFFGPKAQEVLKPFLRMDAQAYLFSPEEAMAELRARRSAARKTPLNCGNVPGSNRVKRRSLLKKPGKRFVTSSYSAAVSRACKATWPAPAPLCKSENETTLQWRARLTPEQKKQLSEWHGAHHWHPNQLRHNFGTEVREQYDSETAQTLLGHQHLNTTEIYAEKNLKKSALVMGQIG